VAGLSSASSLFSDNFNLYWTNEAGGTAAGSVVSAPQTPALYKKDGSQPPGVKVLSKHTEKTRGVCGVGDTVFFTSDTGLYRGVKGMTPASSVLKLDSSLDPTSEKMPCVWEKGGNTLLVADKNGVYRYAGLMSDKASTTTASNTKVKLFELAGGSGVAFFMDPGRSVRHAGLNNAPSWASSFTVSIFIFSMLCGVLGMAAQVVNK